MHNKYLYRISRVYKLFIVYRFTVIVCIYGRNCSLKHKTFVFVRSERLLNSEKFCSLLILQILNPFAKYLFVLIDVPNRITFGDVRTRDETTRVFVVRSRVRCTLTLSLVFVRIL